MNQRYCFPTEYVYIVLITVKKIIKYCYQQRTHNKLRVPSEDIPSLLKGYYCGYKCVLTAFVIITKRHSLQTVNFIAKIIIILGIHLRYCINNDVFLFIYLSVKIVHHFLYDPQSRLAVGKDAQAASFPFSGVFLWENFISEEEEKELICAMDQDVWKESQSGRRKQVSMLSNKNRQNIFV